LYVRPADPAAALTASVIPETREGQKVALVKVRNDGNSHAVLQASMIELSAGANKIEFSPEQREAVHGKNVLAGVERELVLPWSAALDDGALTVVLNAPADTR
jgi:hypothetical protein